MIECQYRKGNCCELIALYGEMDLDKAEVSDAACKACLSKNNSSITGECCKVVADVALYNIRRHDPEKYSDIRDKLISYIRVMPPGPGTELKKIFDKILIKKKAGCNCNKHANAMNRWGCDKCLEQIDVIVGWLQDEAEKRGLPFSKIAAKAIVRLAVRRARKKQ